MDDQTFLHAFENAKLSHFPHEAHIRMAWLYLRQYGYDEGVRKICDGLRHFADAHGAAQKYHETITLFWAKLVNHAITIPRTPDTADFKTFIEQHPHLLDKGLLERHYGAGRWQSLEARKCWVEPDLRPMP